MATPDTSWIEHRRGDGEPIGWMRPDGDDFTPIDLLGRSVTDATDWLTAEQALDDLGIGYLADLYVLRRPEDELRVRIVEVSPAGITVKEDAYGLLVGPPITLPFPAPPELRPMER